MNELDFDQVQLSSDRTSDLPSSLKERIDNFEDFDILSPQKSLNQITCSPEQRKAQNRNDENFFLPSKGNHQNILKKYQLNIEQIREVDSNLEKSQITKITPKLSAPYNINVNSEFEFKKSNLDSEMQRNSNEVNIQNSMHFLDIKANTVTQSQEFQSFENNIKYKRRISNNHQMCNENNLKNQKLKFIKKINEQNQLKNFDSPQKNQVKQQNSISTQIPQDSILKPLKNISEPFSIICINKDRIQQISNIKKIKKKIQNQKCTNNILKLDFNKENQKLQNFKRQKRNKDSQNIFIYKKQFLKQKRKPLQLMKSISIYKNTDNNLLVGSFHQKFLTLKNSKSISRDLQKHKTILNYSANLNQSVEDTIICQKKIHIKSIFSKKTKKRKNHQSRIIRAKKSFLKKKKNMQSENKDLVKLNQKNSQNLALNYELKNQKKNLKKFKSQEKKQRIQIHKSTYESNLYSFKNYSQSNFLKNILNSKKLSKRINKSQLKQHQILNINQQVLSQNKIEAKINKKKKKTRKIKISYKKQDIKQLFSTLNIQKLEFLK